MNHAVAWLERDYDNWVWEEWEVPFDDEDITLFTWKPACARYVPRSMIDVIDQTEAWTDPADTEDEDLEYALDWCSIGVVAAE